MGELTNLLQGFAAILNFQTLFLIVMGLSIGIIVGALPGLTATMAVAVLVPLSYGLAGIPAISLLLAIYVGAVSGGFVSAILVNTPGTPASVATTLDGYPMTQKGEAGRALGWALIASMVGTLVGIAALVLFAPVIGAAALQFSAPEYFALALFGLSMAVSVAGRDLLKGLIAALGGLFIGMVGIDPVSGTTRFTFDTVTLLGGFPFVPVLIGLFAVSEVLYKVSVSGRRDAGQVVADAPTKRSVPRLYDLVKHKWLILKSAVIGTFVGALPGAGADIASFVSYNEAKRSSRHPERFGTGIEEGVVASETANNAVIGGAMIPLLTLAIPGDAVTAVLLGAFRMHDLRPGPLIFQDNTHVLYALYASLIVATLLFRVIGLGAISVFSRFVNIREQYLMAGILLFGFVGSFALGSSAFDVWTALAFGLLGFVMKWYAYPVAPMVLALILGPLAEQNLRQALVLSQGHWSIFFTRPVSAVFIVLTLVSVIIAAHRQRGISRRGDEPKDEEGVEERP